MFFSSARDSINEIKESFSKESLLGSFLFFLVLSQHFPTKFKDQNTIHKKMVETKDKLLSDTLISITLWQ